MKVAHLLPSYFGITGGLQVCVHNISTQHTKSLHEIHLFTIDNLPDNNLSGFNYNLHKMFPFRFVHITYPLSKFIVARYIDSLQKKYKFDLWQINGGYPYGALLIDYFRKNNIPCVLRCSGDDIQISEEFEYGVRRNKRVDRIIRKKYKKFPVAIAITKTVKNEYLKIGVPEKNIILIPNGVDYNRIVNLSVKQKIRKKYNIPDNALFILSVGRNHPKKRYSIIPKLLNNLLSKDINAFWMIIGKDVSKIKKEEDLKEKVDNLILIEEIGCNNSTLKNHNQNYTIPSDDLIEYYKSADVFAMTSMLETFGIVIIEAMASGLPIVCFDAPGVRDVMKKTCGIICRNGDNLAFYEALEKFATCSTEKRKLISNACIENAKKYSWDIIANQYLSVYQNLTNVRLPKNHISCS